MGTRIWGGEMTSKKKKGRPFSKLAAVLLGVICILHAVRVVKALPVTVGQTAIPVWMSVAGALFAGVLAVMVWREAHR